MREQKRIMQGDKIENIVWSVNSLPKFFKNQGPVEYIRKMWRCSKRIIESTLVLVPQPKNDTLFIGDWSLDLYAYIKAELYDNWLLRTIPPKNYEDIYFCYATNS